MIWKRARGPYLGEATLLGHLHRHGLTVPTVRAAVSSGIADGMLLQDLGASPRPLPEHAWSRTAVAIHTAPPTRGLPMLDAARLASLPALALSHLDALRAAEVGRWPGSDGIAADLAYLRSLGRERSAGADLPPYGLCHGQFDAAALHPTGRGDVYVLGWSRACIGPGLLDLVGALPLPDDGGTDALQEVIDDYLDAGGHRDAARTRGGLPAVRWAAGWGRVVQVERILGTVAAWLDQPTDAHHQDHVATLLHEAVQCLR